MSKFISIDKSGVHVLDEKLRESLERKKLSASTINSLVDGCHAQFVGQMALNRFIDPPLDSALTRGTLFHYVMEKFFALPQGERSVANMRVIVDEVLAEPAYAFWNDIPEGVEWLKKTAVNGYYLLLKNASGSVDSHEIEDNPNDVQIASIVNPDTGVESVGLEVPVKGRIGSIERDIIGFIDRVVVSPDSPVDDFFESPVVRVQDWKSGGTLKKWSGKPDDKQGLDNKRQQFIYGMLLEQLGYEVDKVQLIFPASVQTKSSKRAKLPDSPRPGVVSFDYDDDDFKEKVIEDVELADKQLTAILETNTAEFNPSILCHWCPLAKICPSMEVNTKVVKCVDAYNEQPSPQELQEGILLS